MCTAISDSTSIKGVGKGPRGWFPVTQATVAYDHANHAAEEHALLLDFANYDLGTDARVAQPSRQGGWVAQATRCRAMRLK